jgi:hypothetical protein
MDIRDIYPEVESRLFNLEDFAQGPLHLTILTWEKVTFRWGTHLVLGFAQDSRRLALNDTRVRPFVVAYGMAPDDWIGAACELSKGARQDAQGTITEFLVIKCLPRVHTPAPPPAAQADPIDSLEDDIPF